MDNINYEDIIKMLKDGADMIFEQIRLSQMFYDIFINTQEPSTEAELNDYLLNVLSNNSDYFRELEKEVTKVNRKYISKLKEKQQ